MTAAAETPPRTCGGLCPGRLSAGRGFRRGLSGGAGFGRGRLRRGGGFGGGNPNGAEHLFPMRAAASPGGGPQACPAGCARTQAQTDYRRSRCERNGSGSPQRAPQAAPRTQAQTNYRRSSCERSGGGILQACPADCAPNTSAQTDYWRSSCERNGGGILQACPAGCDRTQARKTTTDEAAARETAAKARNVLRRLCPNASAKRL